jgi:signal transduction histidine kinase
MPPEGMKPLPELEASTVFRKAGYDVQPAVGAEPGTVDWFAVPRTGLVRPKTYFTTWPTAPGDMRGAIDKLEQRRQTLGADQAMAIISSGSAPVGAAGADGRVQVLTLRRLVLELSGIADKVRRFVDLHGSEDQPEWFLPRKGRMSDGAVVDAVEFLVTWVNSGPTTTLFVGYEDELDIKAVTDEALYRTSKRFISDPDASGLLTTPQLIAARAGLGGEAQLTQEAVRRGWVLQLLREREASPSPCVLALEAPVVLPTGSSMAILRPSTGDLEEWLGKQLGDAELHRALLNAARLNDDFCRILESRNDRFALLKAVRHVGRVPEGTSAQEWMARVVVSFIDELKSRLPPDRGNRANIWVLLRELAMEDFALGRVSPRRGDEILIYFQHERLRKNSDIEGLQSWLRLEPIPASSQSRRLLGFSNGLVRDYFVAESLVAEVQAGNREILTRYQFPREYVLLFLAILSPDVAATATADRREEVRAEIEAEVERRLQLTLAHQLKRSVGAIRSDVRRIRRQLGRGPSGTPLPSEVGEAFDRVEQELAYQSSLAEQTRLLGEVPHGDPEPLRLSSLVDEVVRPLRDQFPSVRWDVAVAEQLRAFMNRQAAREILHCLIENAAHAAAFADAERASHARVSIAASGVGDTVRVEVLDTGPGVHPDDRENIFRPYVTTKKGGSGRPMGTGLGLTIARRWAEQNGARVGLEVGRGETCFFVIFVAHLAEPEGEA